MDFNWNQAYTTLENDPYGRKFLQNGQYFTADGIPWLFMPENPPLYQSHTGANFGGVRTLATGDAQTVNLDGAHKPAKLWVQPHSSTIVDVWYSTDGTNFVEWPFGRISSRREWLLPGATDIRVQRLSGSNASGTWGICDGTLSDVQPVYKSLVVPVIGETATPFIEIDGDNGATTYVPHFWRLTTMAADGTQAAARTRLSSGHPEVEMILPGERRLLGPTAAPIVFVGAIGITVTTTTVDIDTFTGYKYLMPDKDTDAADWLAEMAWLQFDSAANVRELRVVSTPIYNSYYLRLQLQGVSYL